MSAAGESSRSIAVELALLFLRELEPLVACNSEIVRISVHIAQRAQ
jgi:hypothetical protein